MLVNIQNELAKCLCDTLSIIYKINGVVMSSYPCEETKAEPINLIELEKDNVERAKIIHEEILKLQEIIGGNK